MSIKEKDNTEQPHKLSRLEIMKKNINDKEILYIVDCDKSFCNICDDDYCTLDYFLKNNPKKAKIFINEIYNYEINRNPLFKNFKNNKMKVVIRSIQNCVGYDNQYDYLFKGNKLISIKYDAYMNFKKNI